MNLRDKLARFMYGRYGIDQLYRFLSALLFALIIVNLIVGSFILSIIAWSVLIFSLYRVFSKNIYRRKQENEQYLKIKNSFTVFWKLQKDKWRDRKTHVYRKCPHCNAVLRFKKEKGKHPATCPKCKAKLEVKI